MCAANKVISTEPTTRRTKNSQLAVEHNSKPKIDSLPPPGPLANLVKTNKAIIPKFIASLDHWKFVLSYAMILSSSGFLPSVF